MRKIALFLVPVLLLSLCGCDRFAQTPAAPVDFYYTRSETRYEDETSLIVPEVRESSGHEADFSYLFQLYLDGPISPDLTIPFPKGLRLSNHILVGQQLFLSLEGGLDSLSGIDLSIASACIARTCFELTGADYVEISTTETLANGSKTVAVSADSLFLADDSVERLRQTYPIYRTDLQRRYLIAENITIQQESSEEVCASLVRALLDTNTGDLQLSPLPEGTELLGIRLRNGLCTVDLSTPFLTGAFADPVAQHTTMQSLVNTLLQLPYVDSVEFAVDGDSLTHYRMLDLRTSWTFDDSAVGPVRTAAGEVDATLYLQTAQTDSLMPLPVILDTTIDTTAPELLAASLLSFTYRNGYVSAIPAGTQLLGVRLEGSACTVDLSRTFLSNPDQLPMAIRSVVATLCSLKEISAVQILVEGAAPPEIYADLFKAASPTEDWFS